MSEVGEVRRDRILVVDDDPQLRRLITISLQADGFDVDVAADGEEALLMAIDRHPDLVVLDVMMPKLDGFEVVRRLRARRETRPISVILLTAKVSSTDKLRGLRAGADDYMTKPFDTAELVERIRTTLRRTREMTSLNPLTGLPGNLDIEKVLRERIDSGADFALLHVDIDNFKAYNDYHGVLYGDQAIKLLARCLCQVLEEFDSEDNFIGHVGGDDFAVVTAANRAAAVAQRMIELWERWVPMLYEEEDAERGFIRVLDRRKRMQRFNVMSLSIGIATTQFNRFTNHLEVSDIAAEMKCLAKRDEGSSFAVDRRERSEGIKPADPRSVLICDDDADTREILKLHCEYLGFHVVGEAANGLEAIGLAGEMKPAIVILDQRMPMLEGREAASQIRMLVPETTIISFSAVLGNKPEWADEHLSKYDVSELTPFLGRLLDEKENAQE